MARSSKKKTDNKLDYIDADRIATEYNERMLVKIGTALGNKRHGFTHALAKKPGLTNFRKALDFIDNKPYVLDDGKVKITVSIINSTYSTSLHCSVTYYLIESNVTDDETTVTEPTFKFRSSYSSEHTETLYEAIDNIIDDMTELAYTHYNKIYDRLEKKQGKK